MRHSFESCSTQMVDALKVISCGGHIPAHIVEQIAQVDDLTDDEAVLRAWHASFTALDAETVADLFACATE